MRVLYKTIYHYRVVLPVTFCVILSLLRPLEADMPPRGMIPHGRTGICSDMFWKINETILKSLNKKAAPGVVLIFGSESSIFYSRAFATRRIIPFAEPMTVDTIFDIASCTKVLGTSAMTMLLIQDGRLSLDAKVADIIPGFSRNGKGSVTVRNLLTHTSGLPSYCDWKKAEKLRGIKTRDDALIEYISSMKPVFNTGEFYLYSCLNFLILARLNEIVAGESMHSFLKRRVWDPLGMKSTGYILTPEQLKRTATTQHDFSLKVGIVHDPLAYYYKTTKYHCPGNAGLFMSSGDMAIMAQLILNRGIYNGVRIYKQAIVDLWTRTSMTRPAFNAKKTGNRGGLRSHALGWVVFRDRPYINEKAPGDSFIGHAGWTGTCIWIDKYSKTFVIFNTNCVHINPDPQINQYRRNIIDLVIKSINIYR